MILISQQNVSEPGKSGLEKTAPSGELEFSSRSYQKINSKSLMFFQFDLEKNSSSPEGALFSRPDILCSGVCGFPQTPQKMKFSKADFSTFLKVISKSDSSRKKLWMISFIWCTVCVSIAKISLITTNLLKIVKMPKKRWY